MAVSGFELAVKLTVLQIICVEVQATWFNIHDYIFQIKFLPRVPLFCSQKTFYNEWKYINKNWIVIFLKQSKYKIGKILI